jgi:hypothetical protein
MRPKLVSSTPWGSGREIHIHTHTEELIVNNSVSNSSIRLSAFAGSMLNALVNYLLVDQFDSGQGLSSLWR